jgi:DNA repair exonuclease SbcCD nuclease subunit
MEDHYRVVIVADTHIGANRRRWLHKMGVTSGQYQKPALEARTWARDNHADVFIVAGDLYDQRNPLPGDYLAARKLDPDLVIAGNHDIPAVGFEDALWSMKNVMRGRPSEVRDGDLQIIGVPWPRPNEWTQKAGSTIEEEIVETRKQLLRRMKIIANDIDPARPAIGIGHLMLSYGGTDAEAPNLMLGKDVVIPHENLVLLPNIGVWLFGHVHQEGRGYVGSPQPLDFGDDSIKSFTVVDIYRDGTIPLDLPDRGSAYGPVGDWWYITRQIRYTTSLKLLNLEAHWENEHWAFEIPHGQFDGIRATITLPEGIDVDRGVVEDLLADHSPYVEVIIDREVKRAARVETEKPLKTYSPHDQAEIWHEYRETEPELRDATMAAFDAITGED